MKNSSKHPTGFAVPTPIQTIPANINISKRTAGHYFLFLFLLTFGLLRKTLLQLVKIYYDFPPLVYLLLLNKIQGHGVCIRHTLVASPLRWNERKLSTS
jgi:hypothetical protein